jgi:hypothetical protein
MPSPQKRLASPHSLVSFAADRFFLIAIFDFVCCCCCTLTTLLFPAIQDAIPEATIELAVTLMEDALASVISVESEDPASVKRYR